VPVENKKGLPGSAVTAPDGSKIELGKLLATGGTASVFVNASDPDTVIKIVDAVGDRSGVIADGVGRKVAEVMLSGKLVTDDIVIGLIEERLLAGGSGFIFDGFPRTLRQADALGDLMTRIGQTIDVVIEIRVDDEALKARIVGRFTCGQCGEVYHDTNRPTKVDGTCDVCGSTNMKRRADDTEEALRTRMLAYYRDTSPLIGYYHAHGKLSTIDGLAAMDEVASSFAKVLDSL
jgi:adenylate kinase